MGRVFMEPLDDPFAAIERELAACPLREAADAIVVDFHAEATSEKQAIGYYCDGRASLVVGTHTHVPTRTIAFCRGGTAYMTDAGMTGDYDSSSAWSKDEPLRPLPAPNSLGGRFEPARTGRATLERRCGRDRRCDRAGARAWRRCGSAPAAGAGAPAFWDRSFRLTRAHFPRRVAPCKGIVLL